MLICFKYCLAQGVLTKYSKCTVDNGKLDLGRRVGEISPLDLCDWLLASRTSYLLKSTNGIVTSFRMLIFISLCDYFFLSYFLAFPLKKYNSFEMFRTVKYSIRCFLFWLNNICCFDFEIVVSAYFKDWKMFILFYSTMYYLFIFIIKMNYDQNFHKRTFLLWLMSADEFFFWKFMA